MATTRRVRLQLSSAWPPGWGTGPQPGGQAGEVGEATCGTALCQALLFGHGQAVGDRVDQALVAGEPEQVVDAFGFAPPHELVAGKAGIGPQQNLDPGPARSDLADDPLDFGQGAGRCVDIRAAKLGRQQVPAAEHVQRQIAVAVIVAVEEAALLVAVQRIVGGVEIEDDPLGRRLVRLEEQRDEQALDGSPIMPDLVITRGSGWRMFEPVQRAFAGQRGASLAPGGELAGKGRQDRIVPQLIVIDQVFVAERDAEQPLRHHGLDCVLDLDLGTPVGKAGSEPGHQAKRTIGRAEQQRTGVRGDRAAIKPGSDPTAFAANPNRSRLHCVGIGDLL